MKIFRYLPKRMRSETFLNSIAPQHRSFAAHLERQHGPLIAANYIRVNYGTPKEKPISQIEPQKDRHSIEVHSVDRTLKIELCSGRRVRLILNSKPIDLNPRAIRCDHKFIAIGYRDEIPVDFSCSRQSSRASMALRNRNPEGIKSISVHPIVFVWNEEGGLDHAS